MNLKQLEYFVQVAELGSFSKAAVVLDIAQPALSRQVRSLETELHQQLFLRNGRGVTLTDPGKRLFDHSVAVLQLMAHAREDLGASRNEPVGRVTIGLPPSMGRQLTLPLIDRFKKELPAARLAIVEGLSTHIVEWVTTGRIDIGLVYNPEAQPGLEITPLLQEQLGLVGEVAVQRGFGQTGGLGDFPGSGSAQAERVHDGCGGIQDLVPRRERIVFFARTHLYPLTR